MENNIKKKGKRIVFFITGLGKTGGAERFISKLLPKLKDFDLILISLLGIKDYEKILRKYDVKVYYLNKTKRFNFFLSIINFRRIIKNFKPDILITFLLHADLFGRIFGRIFGVKRIYCSIRNNNSKFMFLNFLDKVSSFLVNLYIPNSYALVDFLVNENKISKEKIKVIPNCVDLVQINKKISKNYCLREQIGLRKNSFLITCVARFIKQKDHITLIKAFELFYNKYGKGYLILVSDGVLFDFLKMKVKEMKLEKRVFFLGRQDKVLDIIAQSNVFVLPSLIEGMSNALIEAMSLKKICIVSDIKENKVLIKNNFNGLTFKVQNYYDLFEKLEKVYVSSFDFDFGQKAYKDVKDKYSIDKVVFEYKKLLK